MSDGADIYWIDLNRFDVKPGELLMDVMIMLYTSEILNQINREECCMG